MPRRVPPAPAGSWRRWARQAAIACGVAVTGAVAAAELLHWRASRRGLGDAASTNGLEAVVVLGYRNAGARANWMNRWRVRAGIRSFDPAASEKLLVLCGGAVGGPIPEAELMATYARELGYAGAIELDRESRTTWENIENAAPLIAGAASIKIVSNSLHAAKARGYLRRLRPDLAARLARGGDYRLGEQFWLKPIAVVIDARHSLRSRR